tara:strand:+ start:8279 stop:9241 length:963 start_codon:yes stop_codon:yes gene_type:complete
MTEFIENLKKDIMKVRKIKESSLNLYIQNLKKLNEKIFGNKDVTSLDFLTNKDKVVDAICDMKPGTRKTIYASILVIMMTKEMDEKVIQFYRDEMEELARQHSENMNSQTKSPREKENWVELKELRKIVNRYKLDITDRKLFDKDPEKLTNKEFDLIQKWVVGSLYTTDDNPPLRLDYLMDIISFKDFSKMTEEDKKKKNFLVIKSRNQKVFSLGDYKTSGQYGIQEIKVGKKLNSVLNRWLDINKSGTLLLNNKKQPMSSNSLTKFLNKVFEPSGKKLSASMLRHIFITTKFPPILDEKQEVADKMLHSVNTQTQYSKK